MPDLDRIAQLEQIARRLEPRSPDRERWQRSATQHADAFLESLPQRPAYTTPANQREFLQQSFAEEPTEIDELLRAIEVEVESQGLNPASPNHLGYIPGGGLFASAIGDFLAAASNRYSGIRFASPGAVEIEHLVLRWMSDLVGYDDRAAGDLTSGGSIASLSAIVTAREAHGVSSLDVPRCVIYRTDHAHHSIEKALRIAGLRESRQRVIAMDDCYRMQPDSLMTAIQDDRAAGLRPWMIVASAGTTDTGSIDPIPEIADIAESQGLWLHLDAAYGGFFALTEYGRRAMPDMKRADSIIMDPHKGLFIPYGTGAVLVKDGRLLHQAHHHDAHYMQDARAQESDLSPADLSPELSRHSRGLRVWLPLKLAGISAFRAALDEKLLLARYFRDRLREQPGFDVGGEPDLSVVTYRYVPKSGDVDDFNRRLVKAMHSEGRVFVSSTVLEGRLTLRAAIMSVRTHREHIDLAIERLVHHARRLES